MIIYIHVMFTPKELNVQFDHCVESWMSNQNATVSCSVGEICFWLLVHRNLFDHIGKNVTDNLCRYTCCATLKTSQRSSSAIPNRSDMNRKLIRMTVFCRLWSKVTLRNNSYTEVGYWYTATYLIISGKMLRTICAALYTCCATLKTWQRSSSAIPNRSDMNRNLIRITVFCRLWSKVILRNNSYTEVVLAA